MQIVDDRLALKALAGQRMSAWGAEVPAITWLAHARLLRALLDSSTAGSLSKDAFDGALEAALSPPTDVLVVLDPRLYTADAARLSVAQRIPLMPAEMLMIAIRNDAWINIHEKNFVDRWDRIVENTGAAIRVYRPSELDLHP